MFTTFQKTSLLVIMIILLNNSIRGKGYNYISVQRSFSPFKFFMSPQIISSNRVNDFSDNNDNNDKKKSIIATTSNNDNKLIPPNFEDMKQFAFILANITEHIDSSPELVLSIASKEMGWLYARDIPK